MPLPPVLNSIGIPFVELQSVDSTNNYALARIHANMAQPGTCYFAHEQTAGKAQRGKSWSTQRGANIILSVVVTPFFLQPFQQFYLSACVAVAAHQFLRTYAGETIRIKWPNDLYWQNKKLGGILIENMIGYGTDDRQDTKEREQGSAWKWAIIGIGININQTYFATDLKNPVSLKQICGETFNTVHLAKGLCNVIDHFYNRLIAGEADSILKKYNEVLFCRGDVVKFKEEGRNFEAVVKAVNESGQLVVQHAIEENFDFGRVEWVL